MLRTRVVRVVVLKIEIVKKEEASLNELAGGRGGVRWAQQRQWSFKKAGATGWKIRRR